MRLFQVSGLTCIMVFLIASCVMAQETLATKVAVMATQLSDIKEHVANLDDQIAHFTYWFIAILLTILGGMAGMLVKRIPFLSSRGGN